MNSYFATVEQQANPRLRGKPVAVLGSKAKRSIIVAASVEAKKFGVKTGTRIEEAPILCPDIVFVHGEPRKYSWVTKKFIEIFEDYTDKVEIFSIDEAFLDVTKTAKLFEDKGDNTKNKKTPSSPASQINYDSVDRGSPPVNGTRDSYCSLSRLDPRLRGDDKWRGGDDKGDLIGAINIANDIKQRIRNEIGEYISCSVGVANNKFLAKTASDLVKPDGLVVVTPTPPVILRSEVDASRREDLGKIATSQVPRNDVTFLSLDEMLLPLPLSEFCGIGRRIHQRLGALGIHSTADLQNISNIILNKEFGIATGEKLKRMAYGLDSSPVISWHDRADAKSYSHSRTLNKDVRDLSEIKKHILLLSEKVAAHMRKDKMMGLEVGLWLRFRDFTGAGKSMKLSKWTRDGFEIAEGADKILRQLDLRQPVRAIGVYISRVQRETNVSRSLLPEDTLNDKILSAMDNVNNRYGENVVTRARLAGTKIKEIVSGMGRDKF